MRIGVDLDTGAQIYELSLPENTTFWFGIHQLLICPRGEVSITIDGDTLQSATLKLMLPPKEIARLVKSQTAGFTATSNLEEGILTEVTFALNVAEHPDVCALFSGVKEPEDILFAQYKTLPALLQLELFTATHIEQITQRVEEAA